MTHARSVGLAKLYHLLREVKGGPLPFPALMGCIGAAYKIDRAAVWHYKDGCLAKVADYYPSRHEADIYLGEVYINEVLIQHVAKYRVVWCSHKSWHNRLVPPHEIPRGSDEIVCIVPVLSGLEVAAVLAVKLDAKYKFSRAIVSDIEALVRRFEILSALAPQSGDSELVLEIEMPDGYSDEDALAASGQLVSLVDDVHRAVGGHGLKVSGVEVLEPSKKPEEVPCA